MRSYEIYLSVSELCGEVHNISKCLQHHHVHLEVDSVMVNHLEEHVS